MLVLCFLLPLLLLPAVSLLHMMMTKHYRLNSECCHDRKYRPNLKVPRRQLAADSCNFDRCSAPLKLVDISQSKQTHTRLYQRERYQT